MAGSPEAPHFPRPAPIDSYGRGGFRFAGMSHRGSLLCLPSGIWAWPVAAPAEISEDSLAQVFADAGEMSLFFLGTGREPAAIDPVLAPALFRTEAQSRSHAHRARGQYLQHPARRRPPRRRRLDRGGLSAPARVRSGHAGEFHTLRADGAGGGSRPFPCDPVCAGASRRPDCSRSMPSTLRSRTFPAA